MDVDGTLTDGKIYMGESGELFKRFDVKDGCGIKDILPKMDIWPVIITARKSIYLKNRCDELNIKYYFQGVRDKYQQLMEILHFFSQKTGKIYTLKHVAYIGDDILDLECMNPIKEANGLIGCPFDAVRSVKNISDYISPFTGGNGAVRDFIEYIASNRYGNL